MRVVLDPNVVISALLSPSGTPARALAAGVRGDFELIVSPLLVAELERALTYPKLRERIGAPDAAAVISLLRAEGTLAADPSAPHPIRSVDPDDDHLVALAAGERAVLVSGDRHLLELEGLPIMAPAAFLEWVDEAE